MNKAQQAYIDEWFVDENGDPRGYSIHVSKYDLTGFARDFLEIDPTPDPETYCVWVTYDTTKGMPLLGGEGYSREKANEVLEKQLSGILPNCVAEYKRGEYLTTVAGTCYEIRKEE